MTARTAVASSHARDLMRLSPARFNRFLGGLAQNLTWQPSAVCPCVNPHSGAADPSCPHCDGKGRRWGAAQVSKAGIVSREILRKFAPMEILDAGDVMLVVPSDESCYALGEYDRVILTDRTEPFSLNLVRGVNDTLRWQPVSISAVAWIGSSGAMVAGALPDGWEDGKPTWTAGAPPQGTTYALTGRRNPEYYCWLTLPLDRPHHAGEPLPRRVVLRRFDLFGA